MVITIVHSIFLNYECIILICMKINLNIFQVLNFLKKKFESMFNISHDQELTEERLSLSVLKGQTSYSFGLDFLIYILKDELKTSKKQYQGAFLKKRLSIVQ